MLERGKRRTGKRPRLMVYSERYTRNKGSMLERLIRDGFDVWIG